MLVVPACDVRVGDDVLVRDEYCAVVKVRNAQGRKPRTGFNLHLLTTGRMLRVHSAQQMTVRRSAAANANELQRGVDVQASDGSGP